MALVVLLFAALSAVVSIRTIKSGLVKEGQTRAHLDLGSAWAVYDSRLHTVETVVRLAAGKESVIEVCATARWDDAMIRARLEKIRASFGLDFMAIVQPDGKVMMRTAPAYKTGDYVADAVVTKALQGNVVSATEVFSAARLDNEAEGLGEKALITVEPTQQARPTEKTAESRGMVMLSAAPVMQGQQVLAVVYGGTLVNRNFELIDYIRNVTYEDESYNGAPMGTATIFLNDVRVATTVRNTGGNRAIGTRVSKQVADAVLDNARAWVGQAFVVNDWYLTAYEPIRDVGGKIIGMLYVGILRKPFDDYERNITIRYLLVSLFVLVVGLGVAYFTARRLARPIVKLAEASNSLKGGNVPVAVECDHSCTETDRLIEAFNHMSATLHEREQRLKTVNRNYMDMLGFVSHELKSPVSTIMNYSYGMLKNKLGPLTADQQKAMKSIEAASNRLADMVRHYLNLSRIENCEMEPVPAHLAVMKDVLAPLLAGCEPAVAEAGMRVDCRVPADCTVNADPNMTREIFENLVSNAVRYGRAGGAITISSSQAGNFMEFRVRNDGEGIPAAKLGDVFSKFARVRQVTGEKVRKGTGLGLFITKQIVESHGGKIGASSEEGKWAEFSFTLPSADSKIGVAPLAVA